MFLPVVGWPWRLRRRLQVVQRASAREIVGLPGVAAAFHVQALLEAAHGRRVRPVLTQAAVKTVTSARPLGRVAFAPRLDDEVEVRRVVFAAGVTDPHAPAGVLGDLLASVGPTLRPSMRCALALLAASGPVPVSEAHLHDGVYDGQALQAVTSPAAARSVLAGVVAWRSRLGLCRVSSSLALGRPFVGRRPCFTGLPRESAACW